MANFDGTDDYFNSREVIERIEELETEYGVDPDSPETSWPVGQEETDDVAEYRALVALRDEADGKIADWEYGETFYEVEYFRGNYAEEFCKDVGYIGNDVPDWITNHIDWEAVADELLEDYTEFEFRGHTYVAR